MGRRNKRFQSNPEKTDSSQAISKNANSQAMQNGLTDALGFGGMAGGGNYGFPGQGNPWSEQVSESTTLFKNLRYYLVSNFRQLLSELYVEIGLVQTIVDVPVDDALRGGVKFKSKQLDEGQIRELQISFDRDDDLNTAGQAAKWNRLFGGSGIIILTDQDPEEPLDISAIGPDTPLAFRAGDMWELFWDKQNTECYDPEIQDENFEFYNYYSLDLHKSRVMSLKGITPPSFLRPRVRGWGISVVEVLVRSIVQYLKSTDLGFEILDEFKLDVYKIKNLVNTLLSPNGQQKIQQRVQLANWQKNYQNAVVMDSEDDFDHKQLSFAGLAEAMSGIRMQVAADMRMPITKLFGTSVSNGFSTDQNDMENYNSMVESQVRNKIKYHILRIAEIKCQKLFGFIPDDLEIEFKPLRELTAVDEENVKTQKFNRISMAKDRGEITTQEYRDACNKGHLFDVHLDTSEDSLNPNDPEIDEVVTEGSTSNLDTKDELHSGHGSSSKSGSSDMEEELTANKPVRVGNQIWTFNQWDRMRRFFNSAAFDKACYEADGGDSWIDERRRPLFEEPENVDKELWETSKEASRKAFGSEKWQFITWWYKKQGGKFL